MKNKIGNVVCSPQTKVDDIFNKVRSCSEINNDLPTIVIGFENAKDCVKDFNILEKIYDNGKVRWTFKKNERRIDYESDLKEFTDFCYKNIISEIKYVYVDIINYPLKRIKNFIKYIKNSNIKYCYKSFNGEFIFIYDKKYETVYGLSLSLCEYLGINKNKVLLKIYNYDNNIEITKLNFFNDSIKYIINNNPHFIPVYYEYFIGN